MTSEFLRQSDICEMSANQQNVKLQSDSNQALNGGSKTSFANISDGASQQVCRMPNKINIKPSYMLSAQGSNFCDNSNANVGAETRKVNSSRRFCVFEK